MHEESGGSRAGADAGGLTRRSVLAGAGGLAAAGVAAPAAAAAKVRRLGEPRHGTAAAEVVGEIVQVGDALSGHGYLTRLAGVSDGHLFRDAHTEAGARITFTAHAEVRERYVRGATVAVVGHGTLTFHLGDGGDFANPATFANGTRIARFDARFQNVASVVVPNEAVTTLAGELVQRSAHAFHLAGHRNLIGHRGLRLRLAVTGLGMRTAPSPPQAAFSVAGRLDLA